MPSVVDICNAALDKLGEYGPITSLDDGNKAANLCKRNWDLVRDKVLRDHPWNFAVKRAILASADPAPEWGFTYRFPFKAGHLRLLEVRDLDHTEYEVEDGAILANATALYVRYVARVEDPNVYDSLCFDAMATRLAFELCESFTQSNTKKDALWQEYKDTLIRACNVDAQENPVRDQVEDDWISVRY